MALCKMSELLENAEKRNVAVGAFSVGNMEMVLGAVKAAEEANTPIILQIAEVRLKHSPLLLMGPMMVSAAKYANVDIAVHLDHGTSYNTIRHAIALGFTSVMYDGSKNSLAENIENTNEVIALARKCNVNVEAELGVLGKNEDGTGSAQMTYTQPEDAKRFVKKAPVDALAVAIGNAHGHYTQAPKLRFDILSKIKNEVKIPLVLHGGSGITDDEFRKCIDLGVRKINIATASFDALTLGAKEYFALDSTHNFFGLNEKMVEGVFNNVKRHIQIFNNGSDNK